MLEECHGQRHKVGDEQQSFLFYPSAVCDSIPRQVPEESQFVRLKRVTFLEAYDDVCINLRTRTPIKRRRNQL
jgi:hypothetical protein